MTTKIELAEILASGESSSVEFKRDDVPILSLIREFVAFSNSKGGMLLLGVEDDGTISGLTRSNLKEWMTTACRDKIRPAISPCFETIREVEPGKDVVVAHVQRGFDVHTQWHNNKHRYYIRVGTQTREPTPQELSRLFQQRGSFRAELRPIPGSTVNDLDRRRLKDYFRRVRLPEIPEDGNDVEWQTLLANTQVMTEDGVTLSGMLLFGKTPNKFLPQAGIDAAAFPGMEKDYAAKERATLRGPMTPLMDQSGGVLEVGMVEQALEFVRRNTPVTARLEDGARRVETPTYPVEVIREAVVNALIHRDYLLTNTDIELAIYENCLELISPGKLPNGMTVELIRKGGRAVRNQLLKDVMKDYGYLEHMGMGIRQKIIRRMEEHNQTDPDLIEEDERFLVRLHSGVPAEKA